MKRIPLRAHDGSVRAYAIVDDEDYEWLNQWRWHLTNEGSAARNVPRDDGTGRRRLLRMHRAIMQPGAGFETDHVDGDKLNNQRANLENCTHAQNLQNRRRGTRNTSANNTTGFRGVHLYRATGRYSAYVCIDGKQKHLGYYLTAEKAAEVAAAFRAEHMPFSEDARATA